MDYCMMIMCVGGGLAIYITSPFPLICKDVPTFVCYYQESLFTPLLSKFCRKELLEERGFGP